MNILIACVLYRTGFSENKGASITARENGGSCSSWCSQCIGEHRRHSSATKDLWHSPSHMCHVFIAPGQLLNRLGLSYDWCFCVLRVCDVYPESLLDDSEGNGIKELLKAVIAMYEGAQTVDRMAKKI